MKAKAFCVSFASMLALLAPLMMSGENKAQAQFGSDACKNAIFKVDNNVTHNGSPIAITVKSFELWSVEEGRWLNEDFQDKEVGAGRQNFIVRNGENIEYGEGDRITAIKVHFKAKIYGEWLNFVTTDHKVSSSGCVANKTYEATVSGDL